MNDLIKSYVESGLAGITLSRLKVLSAASTNATVVKAGAGKLYMVQFVNNAAATRYVKFYNVATSPTVGTTTVVDVIAIPAGGTRNVYFGQGLQFSTGIAYSIVTGAADNDTTAVALNDVVGGIYYV